MAFVEVVIGVVSPACLNRQASVFLHSLLVAHYFKKWLPYGDEYHMIAHARLVLAHRKGTICGNTGPGVYRVDMTYLLIARADHNFEVLYFTNVFIIISVVELKQAVDETTAESLCEINPQMG